MLASIPKQLSLCYPAEATPSEDKHTPDEMQPPSTSDKADTPVKDEPPGSDLQPVISRVKGISQSTPADSDDGPSKMIKDDAGALSSSAGPADDVGPSAVQKEATSPAKAAQTQEAVITAADDAIAAPDAISTEQVSSQAEQPAQQSEGPVQKPQDQKAKPSSGQTVAAAGKEDDTPQPMDTGTAAADVPTGDEVKTEIDEAGYQGAEPAVEPASIELVGTDTAAAAAASAEVKPTEVGTATPAEANSTPSAGADTVIPAEVELAVPTEAATTRLAEADTAAPMVTDAEAVTDTDAKALTVTDVDLSAKRDAVTDGLVATAVSAAEGSSEVGVKLAVKSDGAGAEGPQANGPAEPTESLASEENKKVKGPKERSAEPDARGIKRPAAAIAPKGAKLARTSQAAGECQCSWGECEVLVAISNG